MPVKIKRAIPVNRNAYAYFTDEDGVDQKQLSSGTSHIATFLPQPYYIGSGDELDR